MKKTQHENLNLVLLKSFFKELNPCPLIFFIAIISLLFIGGYKSYRNYTNDKNLQNAQELYGSYTLTINSLSKDNMNAIEKLCVGYKTESVYQQDLSTSNGVIIYGERDFLDISNIELLQGNFPEKNNQVLCEQKYLNQQGITFSSNNESYIKLDGINYLITGIICVNNNIHIEGYYKPTFFLNYDSSGFDKDANNYALYIVTPTQNDAYELKSQILKECNIEKNNISFNNSVLIYTGLTESGDSSDVILSICDKLFYLILVLLVIIFTSVVTMRYKKMQPTIDVYHKLGISKKTLLFVASIFMVGFFFISMLISIAILTVVLFFIKAKIITIVNPIIFMFVFAILTTLSTVLVFSINLKKQSFNIFTKQSTKIIKKSEKFNSELINTKYPFLRIAQINIIINKKRHILSIVGTVLTVVILSLFLYSTNYINLDQGEYKYDYRVDYVYDSMADSYKGTKEIYDKYIDIMSSELFDSYAIYYKNHTLKINKDSMHKDYISFLKSRSTESFMELEHIDNKPFSAKFIIIGADQEQQKKVYGLSEQYELKDNECILVNYVNTPSGKGFSTGLSKGENLTVAHYDYSTIDGGIVSDFDITIKEVVDEIDFNIQDSYYYPIIIVNKSVFNKISPLDYDYPQLLYLNVNSQVASKSDANNFFKGISGMLLTDLTEIKEMITQQTVASTVSIFVMCLLLVFVLATNSSLNIINKYNYERKQIATLKAIGIENKYLVLNLAYEYILAVLQSVIFGAIFSYIACYVVYFYIREKVFYFVFETPFQYVGLPLLAVILIYILVAIPIYKKVKNMKIAETLQAE